MIFPIVMSKKIPDLESNEFLSKSLWPNIAETFLASPHLQKD
jgi:hypothetical protein